MRTTRPISTISFNTREFLKIKLDELIKSKVISFYAFIFHLNEDDEAGKKDHFHVYVIPSKIIQTDDVKSFFIELSEGLPLGTLLWKTSDFANWYLYGLHDPVYLRYKNLTKKYHYKYEDFVSSDMDEFLCLVKSINMVEVVPIYDMIESIEHGLSFNEYFCQGKVPIPQIHQFRQAYAELMGMVYTRIDDKDS